MQRWFVAVDGARKGPFDLDQLVGEILMLPEPGEALVWHQGMTAWTPAGEVGEIQAQLPPPLTAATTEPPPIPAPAGCAPKPLEPRAASELRPAVTGIRDRGENGVFLVGFALGALVAIAQGGEVSVVTMGAVVGGALVGALFVGIRRAWLWATNARGE